MNIRSRNGSILLASTLVFILSISIALVYQNNVGKDLSLERYESTQKKMIKIMRAVENLRQNNLDVPLPSLSGLLTQPGTFDDCNYSYENAAIGYNFLTGWCGPYLDVVFDNDSANLFRDAWGKLIVFTFSSSGSTLYREPSGAEYGPWKKDFRRKKELQDISYTLRSCGKNKSCNDGDDIVYTF